MPKLQPLESLSRSQLLAIAGTIGAPIKEGASTKELRETIKEHRAQREHDAKEEKAKLSNAFGG